MKKSIKNLIITIAVATGALVFNSTFAMESDFDTKPSTTNSQQHLERQDQEIKLRETRKLELQNIWQIIDNIEKDSKNENYSYINIVFVNDSDKKSTLKKVKNNGKTDYNIYVRSDLVDVLTEGLTCYNIYFGNDLADVLTKGLAYKQVGTNSKKRCTISFKLSNSGKYKALIEKQISNIDNEIKKIKELNETIEKLTKENIKLRNETTALRNQAETIIKTMLRKINEKADDLNNKKADDFNNKKADDLNNKKADDLNDEKAGNLNNKKADDLNNEKADNLNLVTKK